MVSFCFFEMWGREATEQYSSPDEKQSTQTRIPYIKVVINYLNIMPRCFMYSERNISHLQV